MLNPALAAAIGTGSVRRNFMYSLIWRSVTWRPGNRRILREKEPIPLSSHRDRQTASPLPGITPSPPWPLRSGYASLRDHGGDSHPDRRSALILIAALQDGLDVKEAEPAGG